MPIDDLAFLALEATAEIVLPVVGEVILRSQNSSPHVSTP